MRVFYHPDFPKDIKRCEAQYREVSSGLGLRLRGEVDSAIAEIKASPNSAGQFLNAGSQIVKEVRRRNLASFPFFILYGVAMTGIGMLTLTGNNVAMDSFGPISDNANGIGEITGDRQEYR